MDGVIVGKTAKALVGALEVTCDEYTIDPTTDDIKDRSTTAGGRTRHAAGFSGTKVTLKGYFDTVNNPVAAAARNLRAGAVLTGLTLQLAPAPSLLRFLAASSVVETSKVTDVAAGRADIELAVTVDGDLLYPGEA